MWDVIKVWTKESNAEVNRLWEMGQRRKEIPYPSHLLTMPEAAGEIIKRLHDAYQLGIVTSRIREGIYKMPVLAPLEKYFTVTIAYEDTTHHKPNPEPLLLACKRLQLNPSEVVYVGDAETDILAARAAKMKVILYAQENFIDADAYAATFQELPECISFLN